MKKIEKEEKNAYHSDKNAANPYVEAGKAGLNFLTGAGKAVGKGVAPVVGKVAPAARKAVPAAAPSLADLRAAVPAARVPQVAAGAAGGGSPSLAANLVRAGAPQVAPAATGGAAAGGSSNLAALLARAGAPQVAPAAGNAPASLVDIARQGARRVAGTKAVPAAASSTPWEAALKAVPAKAAPAVAKAAPAAGNVAKKIPTAGVAAQGAKATPGVGAAKPTGSLPVAQEVKPDAWKSLFSELSARQGMKAAPAVAAKVRPTPPLPVSALPRAAPPLPRATPPPLPVPTEGPNILGSGALGLPQAAAAVGAGTAAAGAGGAAAYYNRKRFQGLTPWYTK